MKKRLLASFLALCLVLTLLPAAALADEGSPVEWSELTEAAKDSGGDTLDTAADEPDGPETVDDTVETADNTELTDVGGTKEYSEVSSQSGQGTETSPWNVSTADELGKAVEAGGYIRLTSDIEINSPLNVTKSIFVDGGSKKDAGSSNGEGCYKITNTSGGENSKVFNVDGSSELVFPLNLTFQNVQIIGPTSGNYTRGISIFQTQGEVNVLLKNTKLSAGYYALNIASGNTDLNIDIYDSTLEGWCAFQLWSPATVNVEDSVLTGINDKSYNNEGWNDFSTIVINQDATGSVVNISNSTIKASTTTGNFQQMISIQNVLNTGDQEVPVRNTVTFTGCSFVPSGKYKAAAETGTEEFDLYAAYYSVGGNTLTVDGHTFYVPNNSEEGVYQEPLTAVAQAGDIYFGLLDTAISGVESGETITLLGDVTEDITIPDGKVLELDLNGRTLTNVSGHTITNNGTLTITGDGTVDNVTHGKAAIQNEPGGKVVLNGGAYTRSKENGNDDTDSGGNSYYNIVNHGTMEINNGVSVTQTGHFSSLIENGWYKGTQNTDGKNSVLTINGGTFNGGLNTIKNDDYGELTINDGTFENMSQATFLNWNIATVNGGTFNAENASSGVILNGYLDASMDQGELTINGGTFNAGKQNIVIATMNDAHSGDIEITGGTLNGSIALTDSQEGAQLTITQDAKINGNVTNSGKADVAITDGATVSGQVSNNADGTMSVVNSTVGSVPEGTTAGTIVIVNSTVAGKLTTNTGDKAIMVGGKTYDTMAEAIKAVGNGQTIYVLKDIPNAVGIAVPSGKNFTIDFGGRTYTLIGPGAGSSGTETNGFQLLKDSTITFKNGTIRIAENAKNIKRIIQNYANLTLEDMNIFAENQVPDENYALSFNNGNITFKGDTDVITTSDETIAFDVCKFASYPSASVTFDESYTGTINGKIVYDSPDAKTHKLVIQGDGTFGTIEAAIGAENAAKAGIEVTSGHFAEPVNEDYLAETVKARLKSASNPEAPYSYYPSVEDAIAAAKPGDTVTAVNTRPGEATYTVTLKFNDGRTDDLTYEVSEDTAIDLPTPSRFGYTFEGWYDGNNRVSSPYTVTKTVTLTAEWDYKVDDDDNDNNNSGSTSVRRYNIEADAGRGGEISPDGRVRVRRGENQTFRITADDGWEIADVEVDGESVGAVERYTFENVRTDHTISATFRQIVTEPEAPTLPFTDVAEGDWYYDAVAYCWENGIMDGTSGTAFAPNMLLNRAMMAQVLYNLADGTASTAAGFPDVAASAWYADAVNWAAANGYVTGYDNGSYGPEDSLTREQLAVILYRYAGSPEPAGTLDGFADAASASAYAVDALRWAVGEGLLTGKDGGRLDPTGTASRAELAQILARFAQM